jgi:hypothetical protein
MVRKEDKLSTLPGVFSTLSAGFELTTRYLWLMIIPAGLDFFLWIGPRLSFRPLVETLVAQLPAEASPMLPATMLEAIRGINYFTYLSVPLLGVPALMAGQSPELIPARPAIIERAGMGEWFGYLTLLTLGGLLLTAIYYCLIAYALRRKGAAAAGTSSDFGMGRFARRVGRTWLRLIGLAALSVALALVIVLPVSLLAGFLSLLSQAIAAFVILGAVLLLIWIMMFFSYTPQGMTLNPRAFLPAVGESVRLFRDALPASLGLLVIVTLARRLLSFILLSADSGTWVTGINLLAHAYISTALIVALFIFYRDRYTAFLQRAQAQTPAYQSKQ